MISASCSALPALSRAGQLLQSVGAPGFKWAGANGWATATRLFADDANLKKTVLYDFHVSHGGKMVPFAGWSMPIQYKDSIMESTTFCRSNASLFDVSHMCGLTLKGKQAISWLERLVVGDIAGLADGSGTLSVFTNEAGGIIDDTVITKVTPEEVYLVVNAGCRDKDLAHLGKHLEQASGEDVSLEVHDDRSLLALQGPAAAEVLQGLTKHDLSKLYFGQFVRTPISGAQCWVTRTGYTGEDGFEISVHNDDALALASALVANERVRLSGLGARDALRLEAGLCLYGNDLDEQTTPIEAGLAWTVAKRRRQAFDFLGGAVISKQLAEGVAKRRVGLVCEGAPARAESELRSADTHGATVGWVTSGAFSPCLKKNIAMGYVGTPFAKVGTALKVVVRGKENNATIAKMPFVKTTYYKG